MPFVCPSRSESGAIHKHALDTVSHGKYSSKYNHKLQRSNQQEFTVTVNLINALTIQLGVLEKEST